jgi:hypothetical protein
MWQETAALRDFNRAYIVGGSTSRHSGNVRRTSALPSISGHPSRRLAGPLSPRTGLMQCSKDVVIRSSRRREQGASFFRPCSSFNGSNSRGFDCSQGSRGCRTVRVGKKRSSARNAAANRAAALGAIGSRGVDSRIAVGAIGLCVGALHPNAHSENAHAYDTDQGALHRSFPSHMTC